MNDVALQALVDGALATSRQRWLLMLATVIAAAIGAAAAEVAGTSPRAWVVVVVAAVAVGAATVPDSHIGLAVIAVVGVRWLVVVDDVTTPWSVVVAVSLLVFHTLLALLAVTPPSATIERRLLLRWMRRTAWVTVATVAVWAAAAGVHRQQLAGSVALTVVAFVAVTAAAAAILVRSFDPH